MLSKLFNRNTPTAPPTLPGGDATTAEPQAVFGEVLKDPRTEFAEIYGSALVSARRMFILAVGMSFLALAAILGLTFTAGNNVAQPWYVEVGSNGVASRPVKMQDITPTSAVLKAELAKWVERVYTIDPKLTPGYMATANAMTKDKAIEQFSQFRNEQGVMTRILTSPDYLRIARASSVDMLDHGVAFVYVTTTEAVGIQAPSKPKNYRIRLNYEIIPPKTEADVLANPLGLFITLFVASEERRL